MGRKPHSLIRERIAAILEELGNAYGYEVYKEYIKRYDKPTMRVIYYHLNKGVDLGLFTVKDVRVEQGNYSWGKEAKKVYYSLNKHPD